MDYNDLLEDAGDDASTRHQRVQCQDHSKVTCFTAITASKTQIRESFIGWLAKTFVQHHHVGKAKANDKISGRATSKKTTTFTASPARASPCEKARPQGARGNTKRFYPGEVERHAGSTDSKRKARSESVEQGL